MDCLFGLLAAVGAVLGTVIGALIGYASDPKQPRADGPWLLAVVPIAAYVAGAAVGSALDSSVRRFRPAGESDVLSHDGAGREPPTPLVLFLGFVFLVAPTLAAIMLMLFAAGLVG